MTRIAGEIVIDAPADVVSGFQRPSWLASTTRMAQAELSGTLTFEPAGAGTRLRWLWDARFIWPLRLQLVLLRISRR